VGVGRIRTGSPLTMRFTMRLRSRHVAANIRGAGVSRARNLAGEIVFYCLNYCLARWANRQSRVQFRGGNVTASADGA